MRDAGFVGLAVTLTLVAGFAIAGFEEFALARGWRYRELRRPGGVAVLVGATLTALITGLVLDNLFIGVAAIVAGVSGLSPLRRSGRLFSFGVLWVAATVVVLALDARLVAFGAPAADVVFTAFLLAGLCSLYREWDSFGWAGWAGALVSGVALIVLCYLVERGDDARVGLLVTGAVFGVISVAPFGAAMLGRTGARFLGLVLGGMAIRAAQDSPTATYATVAALVVALALYVASLPSPERRRTALAFVGAGVLCGVLSAPAALALLDTYRPLTRTVAQSRSLVRVNPAGGIDVAAARLGPIERQFSSYASKLESTPVRAARVVPFVGVNVRAATVGARAAADLSGSAAFILSKANVRSVSPRNGVVDRQALRNLTGGLRAVQDSVGEAQQQIRGGGNLNLLVPQLRTGIDDLRAQLDAVKRRVDLTIDGSRVADRLLGFDAPKRIFIAMQNNAESRATGGYIANYGIVTMRNGAVASREFKRTSDFDEATDRPRQLNAPLDFRRRYSQFDVDRNWTNVNLSPHYPTVARLIGDQYKQYSGERVDGVFALDPIGLAGLLKLTGPVRVPSWPVPLTDRNIANVVLHDEYRAFENNLPARLDFLGQVGQAVFDRLVGGGLDDILAAAPVFEELIETRRLQLWSADRDAAEFFAETGSNGAVDDSQGDSLVVTTQNAAANKTDFFLRRSISYEASVARRGGGVAVDAKATIRLTNTAPASGEPRYVIGPNASNLRPGQNRLFVSVYSPFQVRDATIDGEPLRLSFAPELGRSAYSAFVDIPSGATRSIELRMSGRLPNTKRYTLDVVQQPMITPDTLALTVNGAGPKGRYVAAGPLTRDVALDLAVRE